jgi:heme exporter protein D
MKKTCQQSEGTMSASNLMKMRAFTVVGLLGFPIFCVVEALELLDPLNRWVRSAIWAALLMSYMPMVTNQLNKKLSQKNRNLDEWEKELKRKARSASNHLAIIGLFALMAGIGAYCFFTQTDLNTVTFSYAHMLLILMNFVYFLLFLPSAYVAWTQKPLPEDE